MGHMLSVTAAAPGVLLIPKLTRLLDKVLAGGGGAGSSCHTWVTVVAPNGRVQVKTEMVASLVVVVVRRQMAPDLPLQEVVDMAGGGGGAEDSIVDPL